MNNTLDQYTKGSGLKRITNEKFYFERVEEYKKPDHDQEYETTKNNRTRNAWARDKAYDDMLKLGNNIEGITENI